MAILVAAQTGSAGMRLGRLSLVVDPALAQRSLSRCGVKFDDVLIVRRELAEKTRASFVPYLKVQSREATESERPRILAILAGVGRYRWHCAGYRDQAERHLFCIALEQSLDEEVVHHQEEAAQGFPVVFDGGIGVLTVTFSLDRDAVEKFWWNPEA
jgi:hypothetical protein